MLAEVHNTYHQRHVYLLHPDSRRRADARKDFYVSPFLPMRGRYRMRLPEPGESLRLGVTLVVDGSPLLVAGVAVRRPVTLWRLAASRSFSASPRPGQPAHPLARDPAASPPGARDPRPPIAGGGAMNAVSTQCDPLATGNDAGSETGLTCPSPGPAVFVRPIARALLRSRPGACRSGSSARRRAVWDRRAGVPTVQVRDEAAFFRGSARDGRIRRELHGRRLGLRRSAWPVRGPGQPGA